LLFSFVASLLSEFLSLPTSLERLQWLPKRKRQSVAAPIIPPIDPNS
jgi:hypothetical protein